MRLSILDQSPVRMGSSGQEALQETTELAKLADRLGYTRFWVAEHHSTRALASSSPEVLIAHLAASTKHIRLGSGGVMLPHYSAFKVAENFRLLECLHPGRIDLGVGRAPGGERVAAALLNPNNRFSEEDFIQQLYDLHHFLNDSHEEGSLQARAKATPIPPSVPEQWVLSSSGQSGLFAAHFGMAFSFAHFINPFGGPQAVKMYQQRFQPSQNRQQPDANVAFFVFCSEDEEIVRQQQAILDYRFIQFETKGKFAYVTYDEVKDVTYTEAEQQRLEQHIRKRLMVGTPQQVKAELEQYAQEYGVEEVMAANITGEFDLRLRSYELLAEVFELEPRE